MIKSIADCAPSAHRSNSLGRHRRPMHRASGLDVLRLWGVNSNVVLVHLPSARLANHPRLRTSLCCFGRIDLHRISCECAADDLGAARYGDDRGCAILFPTDRFRSRRQNAALQNFKQAELGELFELQRPPERHTQRCERGRLSEHQHPRKRRTQQHGLAGVLDLSQGFCKQRAVDQRLAGQRGDGWAAVQLHSVRQ